LWEKLRRPSIRDKGHQPVRNVIEASYPHHRFVQPRNLRYFHTISGFHHELLLECRFVGVPPRLGIRGMELSFRNEVHRISSSDFGYKKNLVIGFSGGRGETKGWLGMAAFRRRRLAAGELSGARPPEFISLRHQKTGPWRHSVLFAVRRAAKS